MRCPETAPRRTRPVLTVLAITSILTACGSPTDTHDATPTSEWTYTSTLTATPGPLAPEQPAPNPFEDRAEVQVVRQTDTMLVWSNLMDTCDSNEYARLIDPNRQNTFSANPLTPCENRRRASRETRFRIGPIGLTPIAVNQTHEGTTEVVACLSDQASSYADARTHALRDDGYHDKFISVYTVSPLTDEERATVLATGQEPPAFWVRSSDWNDERYSDTLCKDVEVVIPVFVDWQDTYLFARPYATPQTVSRDEMP